MNRDMMRYYLRRLRTLRCKDVTQRLRLWRFHRHHWRCLRAVKAEHSPSMFFPGEEASFQQLATAAGVRAVGPSVMLGWIGDDAFWDEFAASYPSETDHILSLADAIRSYRFKLFGWKEIQIFPPISWSAAMDPDHPGSEWPRKHYAAIDFSGHSHAGQPDVKWCWELNRFQHLLPLGAAWRITRNEVYAQTAREHIESWMAQIQYPLGIQWSSNLEVGLRMLSWARCHVMCATSASWDDAFLLKFVPWLYMHACHVEREFTVHHTPGNHLLGEACALLQISCLYQQFPRARQRLRRSKKIVEGLLPQLILADGVYAEQSTGYLKFALEFLVSTLPLMESVGTRFSDQVMDKVVAAAHYISCVAPHLHGAPMIGDCDSGSALGWGLSDYWDYAPLVKALWSKTRESRPLCLDGQFPAESFLIVGAIGRKSYLSAAKHYTGQKHAATERSGFHEFSQGGYQVSIDSRLHLVLDGGPLGISPGYGHGHADGLAIILSIDGLPFLVDPGTFAYNGPLAWRNYFRSASGHNTVRIDERGSTRPIATFLWSNPVDTRLGKSRSGEGWRLLAGSQKTETVIHERFITHWYERGVVVSDAIQGQGTHTVEWFFHFHPDWVVVQEDVGRFTANGRAITMNIDFYGYKGADFHTYVGSLAPISGWYSAAYGMLEPCTTLRIRLQSALPLKTFFSIHFPNRFLRIPSELAESFPAWDNMP